MSKKYYSFILLLFRSKSPFECARPPLRRRVGAGTSNRARKGQYRSYARKAVRFRYLLSPLREELFFSALGPEHPVLRRGQPAHYRSLITASEPETLISDSDARYPAIHLCGL